MIHAEMKHAIYASTLANATAYCKDTPDNAYELAVQCEDMVQTKKGFEYWGVDSDNEYWCVIMETNDND